MDLKKTQFILRVLFWVILILLLAGVWMDYQILIYAAVALTIVYMVLYLKFWRCPHCGKNLGRGGGTFCPFCNGQVDVKIKL